MILFLAFLTKWYCIYNVQYYKIKKLNYIKEVDYFLKILYLKIKENQTGNMQLYPLKIKVSEN